MLLWICHVGINEVIAKIALTDMVIETTGKMLFGLMTKESLVELSWPELQ